MRSNAMVAMILAGGRGSRLHDLTKKVAKPAVHFGGKYRIIDFPLSNCANSGINTVGVLTQYESVLLNAYVAKDQFWGLDTNDGGVFVLPPRERDQKGFEVYRGTADAITQNIDFLDSIEPEYVLILSGDHIYKMNYEKMLKHHIAKGADATIAVLQVPMKEASRFGIMNCDKNEQSSHDFGKDIIPAYLDDNKVLAAYRFKGYWKDVGTIDSLWESNMDLLKNDNALNLGDPDWKIYTEDVNALPQFIGENAVVRNSYITQGSVVLGKVNNSVLGTNSFIDDGADVQDSVILTGAKIGAGAKITRCIVADNVEIGPGVVLGSADSDHIELIAKNVTE